MNSVKTYQQVNRADHSVSFGISRMEEIYTRRGGVVDEPHRHDFYTVLLVKEAEGEHVVDFNRYDLAGDQLWFISPGQVHQVTEHKQSFGYSIVFSTDFLAQNNIPVQFIEELNLFQSYGSCPPLSLNPEELERLSSYCEAMLDLQEQSTKFRDDAIGAYLKLLLINSNNLCSMEQPNTQLAESGNSMLRQFKAELDEHFATRHAASDYAAALHVTPDHLNKVVKSLTNKTVKEHIQERITVAAKRMLWFTELSTKEIGYELGFSEPGNFSAFFKKCTGQSPSAYRKG